MAVVNFGKSFNTKENVLHMEDELETTETKAEEGLKPKKERN